jgi:hypothetical protein
MKRQAKRNNVWIVALVVALLVAGLNPLASLADSPHWWCCAMIDHLAVLSLLASGPLCEYNGSGWSLSMPLVPEGWPGEV